MKKWAATIRKRERATGMRYTKSRRTFNKVLAALHRIRGFMSLAPEPNFPPTVDGTCQAKDQAACVGECQWVRVEGQTPQCRDACRFVQVQENEISTWVPRSRDQCTDHCVWIVDDENDENDENENDGYCESLYDAESEPGEDPPGEDP